MCNRRWSRAGWCVPGLASRREGLPRWVLALLVLAGLAVLWWWQGRRRQLDYALDWSIYLTDLPDGERVAPAKVETPSPAGEAALPLAHELTLIQTDTVAREAAGEPAALPADDLTVVVGIGPKIAGMLRAGGITTYAELAAADANRLRDILLAARLWMVDPCTWPEQAGLAAAGNWHALKVLQGQLVGGRRKSS